MLDASSGYIMEDALRETTQVNYALASTKQFEEEMCSHIGF